MPTETATTSAVAAPTLHHANTPPPGTALGSATATAAATPPDDGAMLADYWNPELSLLQVASRNRTNLVDLLQWLRRPTIAAAIEMLALAEAERAARLTTTASTAAAAALIRALSAPNPETARRAAGAIHRLIASGHKSATGDPRAPSPTKQAAPQISDAPSAPNPKAHPEFRLDNHQLPPTAALPPGGILSPIHTSNIGAPPEAPDTARARNRWPTATPAASLRAAAGC